jgi:hypothetical protein
MNFEDNTVYFPAFYCLAHFSDLHRTFLKSGRQSLAVLKEFHDKLVQIMGRKGLKFKREYVCTPYLQRVLQIPKLLVLSR